MNKTFTTMALLALTASAVHSQSVGIGTLAPDASAVLELKSTTQGFLPPRMLASEKALIASPKPGLMVYQTDGTKGLYIYTGSAWAPIADAGVALTGWSTTGNGGTTTANFIGTTDNQPLRFRVNNQSAGEINYDNLNVALGFKSLYANTFGFNNTSIGHTALQKNTTGTDNSVLGTAAMSANLAGSKNVGLGSSSLHSNTDGSGNTATGFEAMNRNLTGTNNTATGKEALYLNLSGHSNTALGTKALWSNKYQSNLVAIGDSALYNNGVGAPDPEVDGVENVAVGSKALLNNNRGTGNTAIGFEAGYGLEDGGFSVALGHLALHTMTSGYNNVAIGQKAMEMATGGDYNISIGSFAMQYNSGNSNTAVGQQAMYDNKSGSNNTAIGENALTNNTSGIGNTALGSGALTNNFTGTNNMGLGYHANVNSTDLTAASAIGAYSVVGCSNCITLGQTQISGNPASTKVGLGMINPLAKLHIKQSFDGYPVDGAGLRIERNGNANHWELGTDFADDFDFAFNGVIKAFIRDTDGQYVVVSDRRSKRDITDVPSVLPLLLNLKAKKYHYNDNKSGDPLSWGFIAQDVEQLFPEFVTTKGPDNLKAVAYQNFSVVAVKAIQEQQAIIEELKNDVNTLKNELNQLKEQFRTLTANK